jgi:hypothetical protein
VIRRRRRGEIATSSRLAAVAEEAIVPARRVENQEARRLGHDQERMRHAPWDRDGVTGHRAVLLAGDVEAQLAVEHVERLVTRVGVQSGGPPLRRGDLDERERVLTPFAGHLDVLEGAVEPQGLALERRDEARRWCGGIGGAQWNVLAS